MHFTLGNQVFFFVNIVLCVFVVTKTKVKLKELYSLYKEQIEIFKWTK